ncbi:MAG: pyridoxal-phosphate dependent enzyme [Acidimicrobiia bacterium]
MARLVDPLPGHRLSLENIHEAGQVIDPVFLNSPQYTSEPLSIDLGCDLILKVETTNPVRSFKGRGADYFLEKITARGDNRQLVCASTGNFGQAMAYACRARGRSLIVYADTNANPLKTGRIEQMGAELRLVGHDFDAAKQAAKTYCEQSEAWMIEDGREPEISEGAGTIGLELTSRYRSIDFALIPLGNGALINGVARWMKAASPDTNVIGVSATGATAMEVSWRSESIVEGESANTIAEGIAVRVPVPEAVSDMKDTVDDVVLVDDDAMLAAMKILHSTAGLLLEPAGAAGIAALMLNHEKFAGARVVTVLTGSNMTATQMRLWL